MYNYYFHENIKMGTRIILLMVIQCLISYQLTAQKVNKKWLKNLTTQIEESPIFSQSFTGFYLSEPDAEVPIYEYDSDKYFTPASNTKLYTFYTALNVLGDTLPTLYYQKQREGIVFWGTGDPSFLNPYLSADSTILNFFKNTEQPLFYSNHNFQDERFGSGWAWDDYLYNFQPEKCAFPIYGNIVQFGHEKGRSGFEVSPAFFKNNTRLNPSIKSKRARFRRLEDSNIFECNPQALTGKSYEREVPFKYSPATFIDLLSTASGKDIQPFTGYLSVDSIQVLQSGIHADSLYRLLLQDSDNFIAEQLLLTCSNELFGTQNTDQVIDYAKANFLNDLPDEAIWRDGSGLSRYNLFTPRSMAKLLQKIYQKIPPKRIFALFPAGGVSGTIEDWYGGKENPYVFAKTGTLSNRHCLSGYLLTKSGKTLVFSFMHNNYVDGTRPIKEEMEKVLAWIYDNY